MKPYKVLFLDWDNTIGDFSHSEEKAIAEMFITYNISRFYPDWQAYYAVYLPYNNFLWDEYGHDRVTKDYLTLERFRYPLAQAGLQGNELLELAHQMEVDFMRLTTAYFSPMPDADWVIPRLAERYKLAIVSNGFVEVQYDKIRRSGLENYFSEVVLSEEVGIQKPNPGIYEVAMKRCGCTPDEVLMIGDSYSSDIAGAIAAGIDQLWIRDEKNTNPDCHATYEVRSLKEVCDLLLAE